MRHLIAPLVLILCCAGLAGAAVGVGSAAPDIGSTRTLNSAKGAPVTLASLRGRVVLIDFWATWCGPCVATIPHVQALHDKFKDQGLVVIGHTDDSSTDLETFIKAKGMTYLVSVGADIGNAYGVSGIPAVFIVDAEGRIAWAGHPGALEESAITPLLEHVKLPGPPAPAFAKPSPVGKVAKLEAQVAAGKVGAGVKALEKLAGDERKPEDAAAASAALQAIDGWKRERDAELAALGDAGDAYAAAALADLLAASYAGHDAAKAYKDQAAALKKDPAYEAGKDLEKLSAMPAEARTDPRFAKQIEGFLKKHPDGVYAERAKALLR